VGDATSIGNSTDAGSVGHERAPTSNPSSAVNNTSVVVGRLAPSPTGAQHLGNARTYLLAWLSARAAGGRVVMRIEDIDSPRVKPWAIEQAADDLRWLGLDWDEGPDIGGPHAPYLQTQRTDQYEAALQRLIQLDLAYPCTCTRKDIEAAASAPHESPATVDWQFDGPIYPGVCASWRRGDPLPKGGTYCWRFRVPNQPLTIHDGVCGRVSVNPAQQLGDFPLTRKNGQASYQLAVVVDDAAMGITEVVRGDDLLPSVFRQLPLIDALNLPRPNYTHVPLVVGPDGRRLAKRHGDTRLSHFRDAGVAAEAIVAWAARSAGLIDSQQPVRAGELIDRFDWSLLCRNATVLDRSLDV
jgi:glutamyl-tRNA synthetase